jgi:hypothetical protein
MKALMALLLLAVFANILAGCARQPAASAAAVSAKPANSPYREWTTAQLQQRRNDLYYMLPRGAGGSPSPQQDEIRAIEGELMRRFRAGDKMAELKPVLAENAQPQH